MRARDLFAGMGWAVAARELDIEDHGVENMDAARETRRLNDMATIGVDVRDVAGGTGGFEIEIASPPCERFSTTGHGDGTAVVHHATEAAKLMGRGKLGQAYSLLRPFHHKIGLVLEPLRVLLENDQARYAIWEQVPAVRPIWETAASALRSEGGWSVEVRVVDAAWYGVPQNRRRAVLMARRDGGTALIPGPTLDSCLADWLPELPSDWIWRGNNNAGATLGSSLSMYRDRVKRRMTEKAGTITRKAWQWELPDGSTQTAPVLHSQIIQTFPRDMVFAGGVTEQRLQIGNAVPPRMAFALLRALCK